MAQISPFSDNQLLEIEAAADLVQQSRLFADEPLVV